MEWSLEAYLIAKSCQLRLSLTGTLSASSRITKSFREKLILGVCKGCASVHPLSFNDCFGRIVNFRRKSDTNLSPGTRHLFRYKGESLTVPLDFVSVRGNSAYFFFVSSKKLGGTDSVKTGYVLIAEAIRKHFPKVEEVRVKEILVLPLLKNDVTKFDVLVAPSQLIAPSLSLEEALEEVFNQLKDVGRGRSDRRKCRIMADPCPATSVCPVTKDIQWVKKAQYSEKNTTKKKL